MFLYPHKHGLYLFILTTFQFTLAVKCLENNKNQFSLSVILPMFLTGKNTMNNIHLCLIFTICVGELFVQALILSVSRSIADQELALICE